MCLGEFCKKISLVVAAMKFQSVGKVNHTMMNEIHLCDEIRFCKISISLAVFGQSDRFQLS